MTGQTGLSSSSGSWVPCIGQPGCDRHHIYVTAFNFCAILRALGAPAAMAWGRGGGCNPALLHAEEHRLWVAAETRCECLRLLASLVVFGVGDRELEETSKDQRALLVGESHARR